MTRADPTDQPLGGTAAELPPGYIRRGMNDDDPLELGDILAPRRPQASPASAAPAPTPTRAPAAARTATPPTTPAAPAAERPVRARPTPTPTAGRPARTKNTPARASGSHVIKPSVVHVPAHLLALVAAERQRSGRSNGEILIAAIEQGHDRLTEQSQSATPIGGQLFEARVSKPRLPVDEPLSPLNIRLYEEDFDVLDRLVADLGVGSRSRLATLALADYLSATSGSATPDQPR